MMTLEEIRKILSERNRNLKKIARETGLSYGRVYYVLNGNNPPYNNVKIISNYLEEKEMNK